MRFYTNQPCLKRDFTSNLPSQTPINQYPFQAKPSNVFFHKFNIRFPFATILMRPVKGLDSRSENGEKRLEIEPGLGPMNAPAPITVTVKVMHGRNQFEVAVPSDCTFGDLKSQIAQKLGSNPELHKILFRGKEKEDDENLNTAGVKENSKVLLIDDMMCEEKICEQVQETSAVSKGEAAVSEVRVEVDMLSEKVYSLKAAVESGAMVDNKDIIYLTEMLMRQLLKLDGIEAEGEGKVQRKLQVRRVQSLVETMDILKSKDSKAVSTTDNESASSHWETFDPDPSNAIDPLPPPSIPQSAPPSIPQSAPPSIPQSAPPSTTSIPQSSPPSTSSIAQSPPPSTASIPESALPFTTSIPQSTPPSNAFIPQSPFSSPTPYSNSYPVSHPPSNPYPMSHSQSHPNPSYPMPHLHSNPYTTMPYAANHPGPYFNYYPESYSTHYTEPHYMNYHEPSSTPYSGAYAHPSSLSYNTSYPMQYSTPTPAPPAPYSYTAPQSAHPSAVSHPPPYSITTSDPSHLPSSSTKVTQNWEHFE